MSQEGNKTLPVNMQYVSVKLTHWNYQEIIDPDRDCLYLTLKTFKNSNPSKMSMYILVWNYYPF